MSRLPRCGAVPDWDVGVEVDVARPGDRAGPHDYPLEQRVVGAERLERRPPQERADVPIDDVAVRQREPKAMAVDGRERDA
jgi:hypothetical protein